MNTFTLEYQERGTNSKLLLLPLVIVVVAILQHTLYHNIVCNILVLADELDTVRVDVAPSCVSLVYKCQGHNSIHVNTNKGLSVQ